LINFTAKKFADQPYKIHHTKCGQQTQANTIPWIFMLDEGTLYNHKDSTPGMLQDKK